VDRVPVTHASAFVLRFAKGREERFVAWTSDGSVRQVQLRIDARRLRHLDLNGAYRRTLEPHAGRYRLLLDGEPIFLVPLGKPSNPTVGPGRSAAAGPVVPQLGP
jgi:hypothetical protein